MNFYSKDTDYFEFSNADKLVVSTSCSLLHTAVDLINEPKLDTEIKSWLAFAAQKVVEVNALAKALAGEKDEVCLCAVMGCFYNSLHCEIWVLILFVFVSGILLCKCCCSGFQKVLSPCD